MPTDSFLHRPHRFVGQRSAKWPALAITLLVGIAFSTPAEAVTFDQIATIPCEAYLASSGSVFYGEMMEAVEARFDALGESRYFGSTCNMSDYVRATCKSHKSFDLGRAISSLVARRRSGRSLPRIPICGA